MSIQAMKQAIEALKGYRLETNEAAIKTLEQAIEQAEKQEPVAYLQIGISVLHKGVEIVRKDMPKVWNADWWRFEPLYTAPPQREWVSLTDDEAIEVRIKSINTPKELAHLEYGWAVNYTRAIEAKLKEKNT